MEYPKYAKIGEKKYKINTSYKNAIKCNSIAQNEDIGDYERALAIIYILFGENGLNDIENHCKLIEIAQRYLQCGNEKSDEEPDMDFEQDMDYIKASFRHDYNINLNDEDMHWWEFYNLINGLSNSEIGDCCVLNRVRNLRNYDETQIKDLKEREKIIKAKEQVKLNKNIIKLTDKQIESIERFNKLAGIDGKE